MIISLVVAMARNRVIGSNNALPWHLPADLKYFKRITMGKPIVMGRKTFESIGRPLPGRTNIVITQDTGYQAQGCVVVHSIDEAISAAQGCEELMIIGGAHLFGQVTPRAQRMYITEIEAEISGDAYFPEFERSAWQETRRISYAPDESNPYAYHFLILERSSLGCAAPHQGLKNGLKEGLLRPK